MSAIIILLFIKLTVGYVIDCIVMGKKEKQRESLIGIKKPTNNRMRSANRTHK